MTGVLRSPEVTMAHVDPTAPVPAQSARGALEELLRRKVDGMTGPADAAGPVGQGPPSPRVADAELFARRVRQFADAVDATGSGVPYEDAVVIVGTETVVAHVRDYTATPAYWQTLAAGAGGEPLILHGTDVMRALTG